MDGSRILGSGLLDCRLPFAFLVISRRGFFATFALLLPFEFSVEELLVLDEFRLNVFTLW